MAGERVMVFSVGDVFPDVPDGLASFEPLRPLLRKADIVIDIQKKVAALLGRPICTPDREEL